MNRTIIGGLVAASALLVLPTACASGDAKVSGADGACGEQPGTDGGTMLDGASAADGGNALGTPGPYFAGTACHCETTTAMQENLVYTAGSVSLAGPRSMTGSDCLFLQYNGTTHLVTLHPDGSADSPAQGSGVTGFEDPPTWRCDRGVFHVEYVWHTLDGDLSSTTLIGPPQCPTFPCAPGMICSTLANPPQTACVLDGSLKKGVDCIEDRNCQTGLSCKQRVCS